MSRTFRKKVKKGIIIGIFSSVFIFFFFLIVFYRNTIFNALSSLFGKNNHVIVSSYIEPSELSIIEQKLQSAGIAYESVSMGSESAAFVVRLKNGTVILLSDKKDMLWQISSLQSIILRLTIEHKQVKTIDFRYSKPVIYF